MKLISNNFVAFADTRFEARAVEDGNVPALVAVETVN